MHTVFNTRGLGQAIWQSGDLAAQGEPQHLLVVAVKGHKRDRRGGVPVGGGRRDGGGVPAATAESADTTADEATKLMTC